MRNKLKNLISSQKWPVINNKVGIPARGVIKRASVREVLELAGEAAATPGFSAQARPEWIRENSKQIKDLLMVILTVNQGYVRCSVTAILADGTGGHFALDVKNSKFDDLRDLTWNETVDLAHRYLNSFSSVPLDLRQEEEWNLRYGGSRESGNGGDRLGCAT